MRCEQCGNEFQGFPGEPCPRCGHSAPLPPGGGQPPPSAHGTGAGSPAPPGWGGGDVGQPPSGGGPPRDGPPWERQHSLEALFATLKGVLLLPSDTFRKASQRAGLGPALLYGLLLGLVGSYAALFWQFLLRRAVGGTERPWFLDSLPPELQEAFARSENPVLLIVYAVCLPFLIPIGLFVWSAIVHLFLMMLGGAKQGYEATFRTLAYAYGSTALFQIVPICGGFVGAIWSLVVQIIGLMEMHETRGGKAAAAVLLPLVLCCCLCAAFFLLVLLLGGWAALASR